MAFFRIRRNEHDAYTVVGNAVLRDKKLSLKAKGLFTIIMALPDTWDFSIEGLAKIVKESKNTISTVIQELTAHGYCQIQQPRNEKGIFGKTSYTFSETPINIDFHPQPKKPLADNGVAVKSPQPKKPRTGLPRTDNCAQISKQRNKDLKNEITKLSETDIVTPESIFKKRLWDFQIAYAAPTTDKLSIANRQAIAKLFKLSEGDADSCILVHDILRSEAWRNGRVDWMLVHQQFNFVKANGYKTNGTNQQNNGKRTPGEIIANREYR